MMEEATQKCRIKFDFALLHGTREEFPEIY